MKQLWFLALALSMGVNAGLVYIALSNREGGSTAGDQSRGAGGEERRGGDRRGQPGSSDDSESIIRSHLDRMSQDLGLDARQRSAIGAVHERLLPRIMEERRRMDALRGQVTARYSQEAIEPEGFRALVREVSGAKATIESLVTEAMLGEAAVLTYEQRQKYVRAAPWGHPLAPPVQPTEGKTETQGGSDLRPPRRGAPPPRDESEEPRSRDAAPRPPRDGSPPPPRDGSSPPPRDGSSPPPRDGGPPPPPREGASSPGAGS